MFNRLPRHFICLAVIVLVLPLLIPVVSCDSSNNNKVSGFVRSGDEPIESSTVTLYVTGTGDGPVVLGETQTDEDGSFRITHGKVTGEDAVLYLIAGGPPEDGIALNQLPASDSVTLAAVLGTLPATTDVVVNERTTIAAAYAMAQFFTSEGIDGPYPGLQNAAAISGNLVDLSDGGTAHVLDIYPNGDSTSTRETFNSLANILAACVRSETECDTLFSLATTPGGDVPGNTLEAAVNIAHFPWQNVEELFELSLEQTVYEPALATNELMTAWTLALRYDGNGMELNGPGDVAFDADGNAWICNNYIFQLDPMDPDGNVCGGEQVLRFTPTGEDATGAPYGGGGVYGAGYGIALDPQGKVWVGNFGFQGINCPFDIQELSQTVSEFASDGTPISPDSQGNETGQFHGGFQGAGNTIRQPQGVVSDRKGNIWIANCSGDSLTQFPDGDPDLAFEIQPLDDMGESLIVKPFDIAIDVDGNAWVTGNESNRVVAFDTDGNLIHMILDDTASDAGIILPMGIASDALGNIWVANSGITKIACDGTTVPTLFDLILLTENPNFTGENASVTMIGPDGVPHGPFKGGGLLIPWGIAVDGDGNVWVANFQGREVSQLCGASPENCPPGLDTGDPISPEGGYFFDGMKRATAVQIDPSGNVWLTNNWEIFATEENPGGHEMVVYIGLAKPVGAPLIGPPSQP